MPYFMSLLLRASISFGFLLLLTRILGKKQLSQLTFFDYVVGITIGSITANVVMTKEIPLMDGAIVLSVYALFSLILAYLTQKSYKFRQFIEGHPKILIQDGVILEENLKKEKMTIEDLMIHLRNKNAFKLSDVEFAVMEMNGNVSVMMKTEAKPPTSKQLGKTGKPEHAPRMVIVDGKLLDRSLADYGYSREWLLTEIRKQGAQHITDVFLAQVDSAGNVYVDLYQDENKK